MYLTKNVTWVKHEYMFVVRTVKTNVLPVMLRVLTDWFREEAEYSIQ